MFSKCCFARFQVLFCDIISEMASNYAPSEEELLILISKKIATYCEDNSFSLDKSFSFLPQ